MNALPDLAMYHLFKHLDVSALLACRLVSRRFCFFANQTRLSELIVEDNAIFKGKKIPLLSYVKCWYFTKEPVNQRNQVVISKLSQFDAFPLQIRHLRRLIFALPLNYYVPAANFINQLTKLKHLEIIETQLQSETLSLVLPELEVFSVGEVDFHLILNCPVLKVVFCYSCFHKIEFVHRESIEHLTINIFYGNEHFSEAFENVHRFQLNWFETLNHQFLDCLPNVREFRIKQTRDEDDEDQYWKVETEMDYLIERRAKLKQIDKVKIFYEDVEMVGTTKFSYYGFHRDFGLEYSEVYPSDSYLYLPVCVLCGLVHSDDSNRDKC